METNKDMNNALAWFERELGKEVRDDHVDYAAVEARLFGRIRSAQELGALAAVKRSETAPEEMFDRVENALMRRIQEHEEYDVPIDAVITSDQPVTDGQ